MKGYYNDPDATAAVIDAEGFYHTGDVGYQDHDGHFYITDRLKDLFKLSNGKYVAPLQVESLLKQSPLVSQPVVVGSGRKQVGALIVPDWEALKEEMRSEGHDVSGSREELCEDPQFIKRVQRDAVDPAVDDREPLLVGAHELGHRQAAGELLDRRQLVAEWLESSRVVTDDHDATVREHHPVQRIREPAVDERGPHDPPADELLELVAADLDQWIDARIGHGGPAAACLL
jgi:acyl-CoA synthetase (AMP-forming)/AMP-acid ligase II